MIEMTDMRFLSEKLNLPMFMVSRNPLKGGQSRPSVKDYIKAQRPHFLSTWTDDQAKQSGSLMFIRSRHIVGKDKVKPVKPCEPNTKTSMPSTSDRSWKLPANRYGLDRKPFSDRAGLGGAHWAKIHTHKPRKTNKRKPNYRLYDLPRETEKMDKPCHKHKATFLSNARDRRATTRGMVNNPLTAYRNASDPGPGTYTPRVQEKTYEIPKPIRPLYPHIFYRKSVVPLKKNSTHPANISFKPGPGRYEIRYKNICPCSRFKKNKPELDLIRDRQNRLRFRRLPHPKIKYHLYCAPDWRHVAGKGFPHLFMNAKPVKKKSTKSSAETKDKKQLKLYHDAKYINMICNPTQQLGSIRKDPMPELPTKIKFDRMIKVISRKQLRMNRKLAFGSSVERWKDDEKSPALTSDQTRALLERIPPERRLRDYPIMMKSIEEIETKLFHVPDHMLPNYVPRLRKRLFKFLPLPKAKILVSDEDIRPKDPSKYGLYFKPLDPKDFFKPA